MTIRLLAFCFAFANASFAAEWPIAEGPFRPSLESLSSYQCPDWFRDAKFGIWAHWGPQCEPEDGYWYPTIADFCGLRMPHPGAGASLRPILADPAAHLKDAAFTLVTRSLKLHAQSVRTARWRCTLWSDGRTEIYDHASDTEEFRDVSAQHADVVASLTARIQTLPPLTSKP